MKCLSERILFFLCNFFAKMLNYVMYICYGVYKFGFFFAFLASLMNGIMMNDIMCLSLICHMLKFNL
jgi:hypothetical protein